jgi:hypothetical protein
MKNYKQKDFLPRVYPLGGRCKNLTKKQIETMFSMHVAKNRIVKYVESMHSVYVYYKPEVES